MCCHVTSGDKFLTIENNRFVQFLLLNRFVNRFVQFLLLDRFVQFLLLNRFVNDEMVQFLLLWSPMSYLYIQSIPT